MGLIPPIINRGINYIEKRMASLKNPPYWMIKYFGNESHTGISVNPRNAETVAAYYACRSLISSTLASIPFQVKLKDSKGNKKTDTNHPVYHLLAKKPNPFQTSFLWRSMHAQFVMDCGNSYSIISRNGMGMPLQLSVPLNPTDVTPFFFKDQQTGEVQVFYKVNGYTLPFYAKDILHFRNPIAQGSSGNDVLIGKRIIQAGCETLGFGIALQKYGSETMKNGGGKRLALTSQTKLDPKIKKGLQSAWHKKYEGPDRMTEIAVLEGGIDVKEIGMDPVDAEFLASKNVTARETCQFFSLFQPSKIGEPSSNSSYKGLEQQSIAFVQDTMLPWFTQFEQEVDDKVFSPQFDKGNYSKFNANGLLRGDIAARKDFYKTLQFLGALSPNEIRAFEDMNPIDGGDEYYMQQSMAPVKHLGKILEAKYIKTKEVNPSN